MRLDDATQLDDLVAYGDLGYQWTVQSPGQLTPTVMRTNGDGDGVWYEEIAESGLSEWRQTLGTTQFALRGTLGEVRNRIRQYHGGHCRWMP